MAGPHNTGPSQESVRFGGGGDLMGVGSAEDPCLSQYT